MGKILEALKSANEKLKKVEKNQQSKAFVRVVQFFAIMVALTLFVRGTVGVAMPRVQAVVPSAAEITRTINTTGIVKALNSVQVQLPAGLLVERIQAGQGTNVQLDDTLLEFDTGAIEEELLRQENALLMLQQELLNLQNSTEVSDAGVQAAQQALQQAQSAAGSAKAERDAAQSALDAANSQLTARKNAVTALTAERDTALANAVNTAAKQIRNAAQAAAEANQAYTTAKGVYDGLTDMTGSSPASKDPSAEGVAAWLAAKDAMDAAETRRNTALQVLAESYTAAGIDLSQNIPNRPGAAADAAAWDSWETTEVRPRVNADKASAGITTAYAARIAEAQTAQNAAAQQAQAAQAALNTAATAYTGSEAAVTQAQAALQEAKDAYEKAKTDAVLAEQLRQNNIRLKRAEIQRQQQTVDDLALTLAQSGLVRSPAAGTVTEISVAEGEYTQEGSYIRISTGSEGYVIDTKLSQNDTAQLRIGSTLLVQHPVYSWTMTARVISISAPGVDGQATVRAAIQDGSDLTQGASAGVEVVLSAKTCYSTVPLSAVQSDAEGDFVYVVVTRSTILGEQDMAEEARVTVTDTGSGVANIEYDDYMTYFELPVITESSKPIQDGTHVRLEAKDE